MLAFALTPQIGFFNFVCSPFYSVVADLVDPGMLPWQRLQANQKEWTSAWTRDKWRNAKSIVALAKKQSASASGG
jgi:hypothetical protein